MGLIRTEKMLDAETNARLHQLHIHALTTPVILFSQRHLGPDGKDEATLAREYFNRACDAACIAAGFPEPAVDEDGDIIHYGVDFTTGEVLLWDGKP